MAWNQISASPAQRLNKRDRNWEERGLAYWQAKLTTCDEKVRKSDGGTALRRATERKQEAEHAVWVLRNVQ